MLIAVIVAVSAEAGVAGVVLVFVSRLLVRDMSWLDLVMVVVVDGDGNLHRNRNRHGLLHRDVLLDGHWVGTINWNLHRDGNGLLDGVGDMLLDVVGLRNGHLHWVWHWPINGHWHWTVNRNLDWVGDGLFDGVWDWLFNRDRVRFWHFDWVRTINGHPNLDWDLLFNDVWDGFLDFHLVRNGDVLHNFVGLWNRNLHWVGDVFGYLIGLRYENFDGVWTVYWDMDWIRNFLFHWIRGWHVNGHFDVFLDRDRHMLDHLVGLWDRDLHWIRNVLFNGVWNAFLDGVRHWNALGHGNGFGDIGVRSNHVGLTIMSTGDGLAIVSTGVADGLAIVSTGVADGLTVVTTGVADGVAIGATGVSWSRMVGTSHMAMSTNVTDVEPVDAIPVAQVQQTTFVQLLLQRHGFRFLLLL